jgi:hypothetical protein
MVLVILLTVLAGGCATGKFEPPAEFDVGTLRERAKTVVEDDIRVSAVIPSRDESNTIFGIDLSSKGIQPLWLEIENDTDRQLHFLRTGLDPEYFSPREVAFAFAGSFSDEAKQKLAWHLERLAFENPVNPRSSDSGFVYTYEDRETKFVSIDLLSRGWSSHLVLLVPAPDRLLADDPVARVRSMLSESKPVHVENESELRTLLENMPCCTANEDGARAGPLNVVLIADLGALGPALVRRHYRYTPMSPLYVFGRPQDVSLKKADSWVAAQPHELRIWLTDILFRDKPVWIGHIGTPPGGRFAGAERNDPTPTFDPGVDEVRIDLVQDAIFSQLLSEIGFVKGAGAVASSSPGTTPGASSYHTDGLRAVLIFETDPVSLTEIDIIGWESLADN